MNGGLAGEVLGGVVGLVLGAVIVLIAHWLRGPASERIDRAYSQGWEDCLGYEPIRHGTRAQHYATHSALPPVADTYPVDRLPIAKPVDPPTSQTTARHQKPRRWRPLRRAGAIWRRIIRRLPWPRHHVGQPYPLP